MEKFEKELEEKLYTSFTLEEYEKILEGIKQAQREAKINIPLISAIFALLLKEGPHFSSLFDFILYLFKFSWIITTAFMLKFNLGLYKVNVDELRKI
jgi:hypothetical protein